MLQEVFQPPPMFVKFMTSVYNGGFIKDHVLQVILNLQSFNTFKANMYNTLNTLITQRAYICCYAS